MRLLSAAVPSSPYLHHRHRETGELMACRVYTCQDASPDLVQELYDVLD